MGFLRLLELTRKGFRYTYETVVVDRLPSHSEKTQKRCWIYTDSTEKRREIGILTIEPEDPFSKNVRPLEMFDYRLVQKNITRVKVLLT